VATARPGPHRWDGTTPASVVRVELEAARAQGLDWPSAWRAARREALIGISDRSARQQWAKALRWSQRYFRAGYERGHVGGPVR
jgi:hypothetical protein